MLFKEENKYLDIARNIIENGYTDTSRTGTNIRKTHAEHMTFSLLDNRVPILSTRKIPVKSPIVEMIWFISGSTDIKFLKDNNVSIWDSWVKPETAVYDTRMSAGIRDLAKKGIIKLREDFKEDFFLKFGPGTVNNLIGELTGHKVEDNKLLSGSIGEGAYGAQWRKWEDIRFVENDSREHALLKQLGYETLVNGNFSKSEEGQVACFKKYDQLQAAIDLINNAPDSRRIIVSAWNPGKLDTQVLPPCFTESALVASPTGYKKINDVEIGDEVYSGTGKKRKVVQKWVTPYKGEMFRFRVNYISQPIECTPNHPFLVKGKGYIEAKDIKEDDAVAIPRVKCIKNHIHEYTFINPNTLKEEKFEHALTLDDYFTLGYYLGNGWCNEKKYRISIAIPHKKKDYILDKIRNTLKVAIKPAPNKSCATYETKSKKFFQLFKAFGQGAHNKRIPDFILNSSIKCKYEFVRGYLEADGCVGLNDEKKFTTVSPSLAYGLQRLLLETGRVASVQYQKRPPKKVIEGRIVNQSDTYSITITKHGGRHGQFKSTSFDAEYVWVGIKNIDNFYFEGNVYNIGVEEEHTYLVNNLVNHNCHSFFQFLPFEKNGVKYLDLALTCRSQDFLVGTAFNVMQYGVLCQMVAKLTGRIANALHWTGNNTHIYQDQIDIFNEFHSERSPILNPQLKVVFNKDKEYKTIDDFKVSDITIEGYDNFHEVITYPVAV